jgi:thiamine kinase-like enzyme
VTQEIVEADLEKIDHVLQMVISDASYIKIERMGGLTNHTYSVLMKNHDMLVVRVPGTGTEKLICRSAEKISTQLACDLGIDTELLYFGNDGMKVCKYIEDGVTMSPEIMRKEENILQAARILKMIHTSGVDTKVPFDVLGMAAKYESILIENKVSLYNDYSEIKTRVMNIKNNVGMLGYSEKVPCHNDPLCENWVLGKDGMYLIDWEYAGMNDGMWDLADLSIEAGYDNYLDEILLESYFNRQAMKEEKDRFLANKIYLDYLWTLWGLTRVPFDGHEMQEYADKRYRRLKLNLLNTQLVEE